MKIWGNMPGVTPVYNNKARVDKVSGSRDVAGKKDELTISGQAKDFATVMKALRSVPDVRESKVAELSGPVQDGTYKVASEGVADKLIAAFSAKRV